MAENPYAPAGSNIIGIAAKDETPAWKRKFMHHKNASAKGTGTYANALVGVVNLKQDKIRKQFAGGSRSPRDAQGDVRTSSKAVPPRLPALGSDVASDGGHEPVSGTRRVLSRDVNQRLSVSNSQRELIASKAKRVLGQRSAFRDGSEIMSPSMYLNRKGIL